METKRLKIGIIGAGAIARRAHLPVWKALPDAEAVWIADLSSDLAEKAASEFEIPRHTTRYSDMLNDDAIDAIDICTPPDSHFEIIAACLKKRKHVIVEKPLTLDFKQAVKLHQMVTDANRRFCIIFNWREFESVRHARRRLDAGTLGQLISCHGRAFTNFPAGWTTGTWLYHPAAVLFDFTPHLLDMLLWIINKPPVSVFACGKQFTPDAPFLSSCGMIICFKDGLTAMVDTSWEVNYPAFTVDLFGTGGRINLDVKRDFLEESHGPVTPLHESRNFFRRMTHVLKGILAGNLSTKMYGTYFPIFKQFLKSIRNDTRASTTISQAVCVNMILEAACVSIETGKAEMTADILKAANARPDLIHLMKQKGYRDLGSTG